MQSEKGERQSEKARASARGEAVSTSQDDVEVQKQALSEDAKAPAPGQARASALAADVEARYEALMKTRLQAAYDELEDERQDRLRTMNEAHWSSEYAEVTARFAAKEAAVVERLRVLNAKAQGLQPPLQPAAPRLQPVDDAEATTSTSSSSATSTTTASSALDQRSDAGDVRRPQSLPSASTPAASMANGASANAFGDGATRLQNYRASRGFQWLGTVAWAETLDDDPETLDDDQELPRKLPPLDAYIKLLCIDGKPELHWIAAEMRQFPLPRGIVPLLLDDWLARQASPRADVTGQRRRGLIFAEKLKGSFEFHARHPYQAAFETAVAAASLLRRVPDALAFIDDAEEAWAFSYYKASEAWQDEGRSQFASVATGERLGRDPRGDLARECEVGLYLMSKVRELAARLVPK